VLIYLSGAIEYAPDHGKGWRAAITPALRAGGHEVYDPSLDEKKNLTEEELKNFRAWKRTDLERFQRTMRKIIAWDLDLIEQRVDALMSYWDEYALKGAGSQAEITIAHRLGIPVYLVLALPIENVSGWVLGCASRVFRNLAELEAFIASDEFGGPADHPVTARPASSGAAAESAAALARAASVVATAPQA
jgi:hypothetical protein